MSQMVDIPKRLPLFTEPSNRDDTTNKDAKLVNCYIEKRRDEQYDLYQRPGLLLSTQPSGGAANGLGIFNWKGDIYTVFGAQLYKGTTAKGAVDTTGGVYAFSSCLGATPKLQLGNGVFLYNYDDGAGLVKVVDADFPAAFKKGSPYLDGTNYVITADAHIQGDDLNDPTSWTALNSLIAQVEPDGGVALGKQLVYIIAFKQWTTEVFYDAANATGSPLAAVQGAKVNYGCASQDSIQDLDGVLQWLASNRNGGRYIVSLNNLKAEIISTASIERLLDKWDLTTIYSWAFKVGSHGFYGVTSKVSNMTLVYDMKEKLWAQWTDKSGNYWPIVGSTFNSTYGHVLQHETNGKTYLADASYISDDGDVITVDIYAPNFDGGTKRVKQLNWLGLDADKANTNILVRCNDYDFDPRRWTNFRRVDMSKKSPGLPNCGSFGRRAYHLRHQTPGIKMPRLRSVDLQIDLGTRDA